ncbi:MAG TPA: SOS response-associated peptidase [Chloroflexota bacterium]|nr:SOS response-associated peptidase [Chloroflexota bacterium]
MCGRYTLTRPEAELVERFEIVLAGSHPLALTPRYNIAPKQPVLAIVRAASARVPSLYRWGLIPPWAKDSTPGPINARSETAAGNAMFRKAMRQQRCVIPADGFYEWRKDESGKTPIRFTLNNGGVFALAGLYEYGPANAEGYREASVCILTTRANSLVAPVHDRMPVILRRKLEDLWLDPDVTDPAALAPAFEPYPVEAMRAYEVSRLVNNPRNDGVACVQPVA